MNLAIVILAAGKGTRMESDLAKVLHPLCEKPLVHWVLEAVAPLEPQRTVAVVGHQAEKVKEQIGTKFPHVEYAVQSEMLGTGHAVQQVEPLLRDFSGDIIVMCGDAPLVQTQTLQELIEKRRAAKASASMMVAEAENPGSYGRVIVENSGRISQIVEAKDATQEQLAVKYVNAGTYCFESSALWHHLAQIGNSNASGEYYLTDVIGLMNAAGQRVEAQFVSEREMTGVNTRAQLQELEQVLRAEGVA